MLPRASHRATEGTEKTACTSFFLAVLLAVSVLAQNPAPRVQPLPPPQVPQRGQPTTGFIIRSNTDVVLIDVQVTKDGKPVKGLKASQFTVFEDDKPQKLTSFDYFDIETLETASAEELRPVTLSLGAVTSPGGAPPEKLRELVRDRRMLVIFFDMTSMQPDELLRATDSATKYIRDKMTPADLVGVVAFANTMKVLADFTTDRDLLQKAVKKVRPGKDAELAGSAATDDTSDTAEDTGAAFTADELEFNIFNTDRKLAAVQDLSNLLRAIPGKKSVIHFTGGVSQTGSENRSQLRAATDAANRADVSFYTVDARGLQAAPPGGDASVGAASGNAMFHGAAVFRQTDSRNDSRDTLSTLASDTGGRAFFDEGDLASVFGKVQADTSGYYLLGYNSTNLQMNGKWRRVRVRLDASGVKVRFREGYYAPKDYKIYSTQDRERQLGDAMATENYLSELPVVLETNHFRLNGRANEIFVPVSAKLASSALDWAEKKGRKEAQFDFAAEVREEKTGRVVGTLRDTIKVRLDQERFDQIKQRALVYQGGLILGPGSYRLKFLARENETGKIGTFEEKLFLPTAQPQKLELSSVLLSSQMLSRQAEPARKTKEVETKALARDARLEKSPFEVGGDHLIPSVTRVFTSDQRLYVLFQAYAPANVDPAVLRAGLVLFRNGVKSSETPLVEPAEVDAKTRTVSFRISMPLEKMTAGRYTVQAVTVEPGGEHAAFARSYFALRPPLASKPAGPPSE